MEPSDEIRNVVLALYRSWEEGDPAYIRDAISTSEHTVAIGTEPDEVVVGGQTLIDLLIVQFGEYGRITVDHGRMFAFVHGDVGWVVDTPTITLEDATQVPSRNTLVLVREDGMWKIVHMHSSVGIPSPDAFGREFTTSLGDDPA